MKRKLQQLFCPNLQRCSSGLLAIGRAGPSIRRYSDEASSTAADETTKKPIRAGVMLSRPAILTEEPTAFEKAFFLYQRRMNERLALPFTRYFYLKKGTNAFVRWKWSLARRKTVARDIGVYDAYGKSAWNDEALVGAPESEPSHQVGALIADSDSFSTESGTGGPAAARSPTELAARLATGYADADERSLRRALRRTVTLMIQNEKGHWVLPTADLVERETLRQAAERILSQLLADRLSTWVVGNAPVCHFYKQTFIMKARVLLSERDVAKLSLPVPDFQWLSREEIQERVSPQYWHKIHDILPMR